MTRLQQIIRATIAYSDVFDYPLSRAEISLWGIGGVPDSFPKPHSILEKNGYLVLPGRGHTVALREYKREKGKGKWATAMRASRMLSQIPTVVCIGVTGGLAMDNAGDDDDVDLFFVTRQGAMWTTRMLVTVAAELMGVRRHPQDRSVSGKVCLNMFMAEDDLEIPVSEQDLFAAHEVLQMKPVWVRGDAYVKFLDANRWSAYFLPNAWKKIWKDACTKARTPQPSSYNMVYILARLIEPFIKSLQLAYMKNKRTHEVIRSGMIRFHPHDARVWIRKKFQKRLDRWDIPIDKFFYHR